MVGEVACEVDFLSRYYCLVTVQLTRAASVLTESSRLCADWATWDRSVTFISDERFDKHGIGPFVFIRPISGWQLYVIRDTRKFLPKLRTDGFAFGETCLQPGGPAIIWRHSF
jgi:hypothetical protein